MRRLVTLLVALAATLALVAGFAPTASAGSQKATDAKNDVTRLDLSTLKYKQVKGHRDVDVVAGTARYARKKLVLTVTVRRLSDGTTAAWQIRRPNGGERQVWVSGGRVMLMNGKSQPVKCRGMKHSSSTRRDRVKAVVPRKCLGNAPWIRFAAGMSRASGDYVYGDNARVKGFSTSTKPAALFGPKVRYN